MFKNGKVCRSMRSVARCVLNDDQTGAYVLCRVDNGIVIDFPSASSGV